MSTVSLASSSVSLLIFTAYKVDGEHLIWLKFQPHIENETLVVEVNYSETDVSTSLGPVAPILDWITRATRPGSTDAVEEACSSFQIASDRSTSGDFRFQNSKTTPTQLLSGISIVSRLNKSSLRKTSHDCWLDLFQSGWVMHSDKPYKSDKSFGKGLEMSFEQMTALACTEYPVLVNDGVVLLGYQTLLVPTEITADYVQFHLEVNHTGQMNPFSMNYGPRALTIDHLAFKELRCYVGWCEAAHIMLGNQHGSAYDVRYSGGQQKKSSLHFDGISTGFQFFPAAPIHTGVTGQANFSLTTNRVNFSPSNVYSKMLRDAANDVAMVYDARSRQSWVVPKISVLLHMAHAWIKENSSATEF